MDAETRQRIFDPFFTTKVAEEGTGLGLSTVYGIVQQHQGWIECDSEPGAGATFSVYLPLTDRKISAAENEEEEEPVLASGTILFIDDEVILLELVKRGLEYCGYTVLTAVDGLDGLEVFQRERERINLVLLDLSMPRLSGQEVLAQLQSLDSGVKVIIFTGQDTREDRFEGVEAIIPKPLRMNKLAHAVYKALED
jgi:two-component system cell cycle sensor histidine kinase/response regulator CckA